MISLLENNVENDEIFDVDDQQPLLLQSPFVVVTYARNCISMMFLREMQKWYFSPINYSTDNFGMYPIKFDFSSF